MSFKKDLADMLAFRKVSRDTDKWCLMVEHQRTGDVVSVIGPFNSREDAGRVAQRVDKSLYWARVTRMDTEEPK